MRRVKNYVKLYYDKAVCLILKIAIGIKGSIDAINKYDIKVVNFLLAIIESYKTEQCKYGSFCFKAPYRRRTYAYLC
ncbi:Uncharacterised protein [Staphylococcus agnetis]|nr:Uncharacterised protein [Staphylococcus agnetis]